MSQPELRTFIDSLWLLFTKGVRYSTVIDVGSADGQFFLHLFDKGAFRGATPLNIDANMFYEESLRAIQDVVGGHYRICAVTDHVGNVEFTSSVHPYWSSICAEDDPYWQRLNMLSSTKSIVPATTLDTLKNELGLRPPFLLKLDVQGSEKNVLEGAADLLADTSVVVCETDIDDFQDINSLLRKRDFLLFDVTTFHYAPDGTLGYFYPIYINRSLNAIRPKSFWEPENNDAVIAQQIERRKSILKFNAETLTRIRNTRDSNQPDKPKAAGETISRNALCPCGSGRKYKHCCGVYVA